MMYTEWGEDLAAALAEPFAPELHKTKKQGGAEITFVEWHRYADRLNQTVGPQGWEVRVRFHEVGGKLLTVTTLTILGVTKENVGDEDEDKDSYGTASTNSFAQSYKRAAALFGLGLYMYDKSGRAAATRPTGPRAVPNKPTPPTIKQIELLDKLMKSSVWTQEEKDAVAENLTGADKAKVSRLIDRAQAVLTERKAAV